MGLDFTSAAGGMEQQFNTHPNTTPQQPGIGTSTFPQAPIQAPTDRGTVVFSTPFAPSGPCFATAEDCDDDEVVKPNLLPTTQRQPGHPNNAAPDMQGLTESMDKSSVSPKSTTLDDAVGGARDRVGQPQVPINPHREYSDPRLARELQARMKLQARAHLVDQEQRAAMSQAAAEYAAHQVAEEQQWQRLQKAPPQRMQKGLALPPLQARLPAGQPNGGFSMPAQAQQQAVVTNPNAMAGSPHLRGPGNNYYPQYYHQQRVQGPNTYHPAQPQ